MIHADGSRSAPDAVVAATGYTSGLHSILGPLGLLDHRDLPTIGSRGGPEADGGLYTVGISILLSGLLREIAIDVRRLVRAIADDGWTTWAKMVMGGHRRRRYGAEHRLGG